jgi:hypothetical protein
MGFRDDEKERAMTDPEILQAPWKYIQALKRIGEADDVANVITLGHQTALVG